MTLPSRYGGPWKRRELIGNVKLYAFFFGMFSLLVLAWVYVVSIEIYGTVPKWTLETMGLVVGAVMLIILGTWVTRYREKWDIFRK